MTPEERRARKAEYQRRWRAKQRTVRQLEPCGTLGALRRHERAGEELDPACAEVRRTRNAENYRKRKARQARQEGTT